LQELPKRTAAAMAVGGILAVEDILLGDIVDTEGMVATTEAVTVEATMVAAITAAIISEGRSMAIRITTIIHTGDMRRRTVTRLDLEDIGGMDTTDTTVTDEGARIFALRDSERAAPQVRRASRALLAASAVAT
jgi:hypothetical protein